MLCLGVQNRGSSAWVRDVQRPDDGVPKPAKRVQPRSDVPTGVSGDPARRRPSRQELPLGAGEAAQRSRHRGSPVSPPRQSDDAAVLS